MPRPVRMLLPLALAAGAMFVTPSPAQAEVTSIDEAKTLAGDWIDQRFQAQSSHSAAGTADVIFALAGTGGHQDTIDDALDVLADTAPAYVGEPGEVTNPGGLAKVMLAVQVAGGDPAQFAGYDLEAELRERIADDGSIGDVHPFVAPLAIAALTRTGGGVPEATAEWYAAHQCVEDGHDNLGAYGWGSDSCATADTDVTAMALQVLHAAGQADAAAEATDWLLADQSATGGFGGNDNTNSTGLAGQALRTAGEQEAADAAAAHVMSLQFGADAADASHIGGIRWLPGQNAPNAMATYQGVLAFGAPSFPELVATPTTPEPTPSATPSATPSPTTTSPPAPESTESGGTGGELPATGTPGTALAVAGVATLLSGAGLVFASRHLRRRQA